MDILTHILKQKKLSLKNALVSIALSALAKEVGFRFLEATLREYHSRVSGSKKFNHNANTAIDILNTSKTTFLRQ